MAAIAPGARNFLGGAAIFAVAGEFEGRPAQAFEGIAMLAAVGVLTWMIVWMKQQSASIKGGLERDMAAAIGMGSVFALALIPFTAILREGLETAVVIVGFARVGSQKFSATVHLITHSRHVVLPAAGPQKAQVLPGCLILGQNAFHMFF